MNSTTEAERQAAALERYAQGGEFASPYGWQWGAPQAGRLAPVLSMAVDLARDVDALEIGSGGGRWSLHLWDYARSLICVDGTPASEAAIRSTFAVPQSVGFLSAPDGLMPSVPDASIGFVFSFDTFVHFDRPLVEAYLREIARVLVPGGRLMLHHAFDLGNAQPFFRYLSESDVAWMLSSVGLVQYATAFLFAGESAGSRVVLARKWG